MEPRNQITFYASFYEAIQLIPQKYRLATYNAIVEYGLFGKIPADMPDVTQALFVTIRPVLDSARRKAENGHLGGSKPKAKPEHPQRQMENDINVKNDSESYSNQLFETFWTSYPSQGRRHRTAALRAWTQIAPDQQRNAINHLDAWKNSSRWIDGNGNYIPNIENFLNPENGYLTTMPPAATQKQPYGCGNFGVAELEAIRRVMEDPQFACTENNPDPVSNTH